MQASGRCSAFCSKWLSCSASSCIPAASSSACSSSRPRVPALYALRYCICIMYEYMSLPRYDMNNARATRYDATRRSPFSSDICRLSRRVLFGSVAFPVSFHSVRTEREASDELHMPSLCVTYSRRSLEWTVFYSIDEARRSLQTSPGITSVAYHTAFEDH